MSFKKVTHCIFDLDGLLLDTETIYEKVTCDFVGEYGKIYTKETQMKVLGTPEPVTAKIIVEDLQLPMTPQEFSSAILQRVINNFETVPIFPGAERLLRHLHKHNVPIALATSASKEATERKIKRYTSLFDVFHHKVMGSSDPEVKNGKPSPDIFLICASRFLDKPKPEQCLVFEDAPNGVKAAVSAGMQVVMVPAKDTSKELCKLATLVLNSLEEFKPELFSLPPYEKF